MEEHPEGTPQQREVLGMITGDNVPVEDGDHAKTGPEDLDGEPPEKQKVPETTDENNPPKEVAEKRRREQRQQIHLAKRRKMELVEKQQKEREQLYLQEQEEQRQKEQDEMRRLAYREQSPGLSELAAGQEDTNMSQGHREELGGQDGHGRSQPRDADGESVDERLRDGNRSDTGDPKMNSQEQSLISKGADGLSGEKINLGAEKAIGKQNLAPTLVELSQTNSGKPPGQQGQAKSSGNVAVEQPHSQTGLLPPKVAHPQSGISAGLSILDPGQLEGSSADPVEHGKECPEETPEHTPAKLDQKGGVSAGAPPNTPSGSGDTRLRVIRPPKEVSDQWQGELVGQRQAIDADELATGNAGSQMRDTGGKELHQRLSPANSSENEQKQGYPHGEEDEPGVNEQEKKFKCIII